MKRWLLFFFCWAFAGNDTLAQNAEKIVVGSKDTVLGYYLAIKPPVDIKAVLVLLDGFAKGVS